VEVFDEVGFHELSPLQDMRDALWYL